MPPYDSDSGEEDEEYTQTNILLGYATKEATGDAVSHLGGLPVSFSVHSRAMKTDYEYRLG
jgi:hypothetical protein